MGAGPTIAVWTALALLPGQEPAPLEILPLATPEQFRRLPAAPVVNGMGQVLFRGEGHDGRAGLHLALGTASQPVVRVGDLVRAAEGPLLVRSLGAGPALNDRGAVAFSVGLGEGEAVLVRDGVGGLFEFVADSSEAFRRFGPRVQMNAAGEVMFLATVDPPGHPDRDDGPARWTAEDEEPPPPLRATRDGMREACHAGLFLDTAEGLEVAARTTGQYLDLGDDFQLAGTDVLVFRAWQQGLGECLVRVTAFAPPVVVVRGRDYPALHEFSVNQRGTLVVRCEDPEGRPVLGLSRGAQVGIQSLTVEGEPHPALAPGVCVGADDRVLCVVRTGERDRLLLRDPAGRWQELLRSGQAAWPGAVVARIQVSAQAFGPSGRVGVRVTLADGGGEAILLLVP